MGAVFDFLLIIANIATAVVLYPIVKRHSEIGALGYVTARIMESAFIMVGILSLSGEGNGHYDGVVRRRGLLVGGAVHSGIGQNLV